MKPAYGNDLALGCSSEGQMIPFPRQARATHLYCCGGTGTGKSKFLEHLIRQDIKNWRRSKCGLLLLDPHGSLYDSLMAWCAWHDVNLPIIPIDLRQEDTVIAYNVLRPRKGSDPAVIVNNFVQAMAYVWGQTDTSQTPLFARWASNILGTLYEKNLTLLEAEYLIDRMAKHMRVALTNQLQNRSMANDWLYANALNPKDFEREISSTVNRLHSFLSTRAMRQMFGQSSVSIDLGKCLDEGNIVLVSLATERGRVSNEDASLFATLLLSDLWTAAKERGKNKNHRPFYVYVDEFQNFVTPTIAKNLDEARGFGLHLTLAHQFPNQLLHAGAHGKQVYDSVMANARTKVVFGLEGEENLRPLAQSLFMGAMSPEKIKLSLYSTKVMNYAEEERTIWGSSRGRGHGAGSQSGNATGAGMGGTESFYPEGTYGSTNDPYSISESQSDFSSHSQSDSSSWSETESDSHTTVPFLKPVLGQELSSVQYESMEEQLHRAMSALFDQEQRRAVARVVGTRLPVAISTPTIHEMPILESRVRAYTQKLLNCWPFALPTVKADMLLAEQEKQLDAKFIAEPAQEEPVMTKSRVRKRSSV